ncbi:OBERON-like protein [Mercurialis annua]|uniref:OBERON-like protein n=1 Tax=Mercurialis annua TaxID=3986 RepID=UPI00215E3C90|nr:OBERON-like protein [Mercurialis annua]
MLPPRQQPLLGVQTVPVMAKKVESIGKAWPEKSVIRRMADYRMFLRDIARDGVDIISEKMNRLSGEFLAELKNGLGAILEPNGDPRRREECFILQKLVKTRSDLTTNILLRAHRVHLEILVAIATGIRAFLHPTVVLPPTSLIEVLIFKRCKNLACQHQLPADDCVCKICRNGFCNQCMCVICHQFDFEVNTCRWIGCDVCSHWTHTDCAIRYGLICSAPSETLFRCLACNRTSELLGWVKDVFGQCGLTWNGRNAVMRELDFVSRIFRGSRDGKGMKLFWKCEKVMDEMKRGLAESAACRVFLTFLQELEADSLKTPVEEPCDRIGRVLKEVVKKMEMVADEKMRMVMKTRTALEAYDCELENKAKEVSELMVEKQKKKLQIEELERIVRLKQEEADMFQLKANAAKQEAAKLQRTGYSETDHSEEEYGSSYLKLSLS